MFHRMVRILMKRKFSSYNIFGLNDIWAASWQNQQNGLCAQWRLRSAFCIRPVWSVLLCAQWVAKEPSFLHADSEESDQTGQMPKLIWVFAGRTHHFVDFVVLRLKWWFILPDVYLCNFYICKCFTEWWELIWRKIKFSSYTIFGLNDI